MLGIPATDQPLSNAQFHKMLNPQDVPARLSALHELIEKHQKRQQDPDAVPEPSFSAKYRIRNATGGFVDVEESANLHFDGASGQRTLRGVLRIRHQEQLKPPGEAELSAPNVAMTQEGVHHFGRVGLQHKIEEWIETNAVRQNVFGYILVVGIDRLSLFNEAFGARYADEVIACTGERLAHIIGGSGFVSRIDGDVFGIFCHEAPSNEMAAMAKYVLRNFNEMPLATSVGPIAVGVSVGGVGVDRKSGREAATTLTKAEMAMRAAKAKGRNCFVSYSEAAHHVSDTKLLLESGDQFLRALHENRVKLAFQPVINSKEQRVSFHECLVRLIDENGKLHSAGQFIPAIERLGLGPMVDQFALRMAIQELTMFPDLELSVNVSNLSLTHQDWLRGLVAALRDRPSVAKRLIVEITESAIIDNLDRTMRVVRTLQDLGCRVALDDFGAGYTAFAQLRELDVDIVKIDKSFIRNMDEDHNRLFVKTLQALADGINVETVGEGAETTADATRLAGDGVTHIQGYIYGFPQVERVWLPKDHVYRRIKLESGDGAVAADDQYKELMQDMAGWGLKA